MSLGTRLDPAGAAYTLAADPLVRLSVPHCPRQGLRCLFV